MTPVIETEHLAHFYRSGAPVLRDIDLRVEAGEIVGIIGLSGAGKSTLLRCINGLVTPTGGTCRVFGEPTERLREGERRLLRRRIGMIFQEFNLIDRLTVLKNVLVGRLGYYGTLSSCLHLFSQADIKLAYRCIDEVGLSGMEMRRARDLSGGQKQRVAIARAMAQGAEIILADEATANLDMVTKDEIMNLLRELARSGNTTLVLSMHDLPLARRYCTRIIGLKNGEIAFDAPPAQLSDAAVSVVLGHVAIPAAMGGV